jgi:glycosyltransferase involved in cell wall biosynthesis
VNVSVIVPVRDDPRVDDLLASLAAQRNAPPFEVLVALDGARREPRVPTGLLAKLLRLPPRGPYPARNAAIREATGDLLLFTDSDCLCPPDWMAGATRFFEEEETEAVQGASRASEDSRLARLVQREYDRYVESHARDGYRHFCNTRNFAIRTRIAREHPLPEDLPRGGDGVYGRMLERAAVGLRYEPEWWIAHRHPTSRWDEGRRAFAQGRDGALWSRAIDADLFRGSAPEAPAGPGAWLLSRAGGGLSRRVLAAALVPAAALLAVLSAVLPGRAGAAAFSRFHRAAHLAGRLSGEARSAKA